MELVGVQIEESWLPSFAVVEEPLDDTGFVDLAITGTRLAGEFLCAECGYGAVFRRVIPACPMCGGTVWESRGPVLPRPID